MQRGILTLAISGMMAFSQSGFAADPAADQPSGQTSVGTARIKGSGTGNRTAKKPKAPNQAASKNYYKDLFGDEDVTPTSITKRNIAITTPAEVKDSEWDEDLLPDTSPSSAKSTAQKNNVRFDDEELPVDDAPAHSGKNSVGGVDKSKPSAKVTQAIFDRNSGKKTPIQQIRNDGRPRTAPPVAGNDEPVEKTVRKDATKEANSRASAENDFEIDTPSSSATIDEAGPQSPHVTVEWIKRGEFNVGQECLVDLIVRNVGDAIVSQVAIDAIFPATVRLTGAEPRPASATDRLTWTFDQLPPAVEKKITIKLVPSARGEIGATAQVRYTSVASAAFAVSEPLLKVVVKSPSKEVMVGDPVSQMITVTNPGTGTVHDVKVEAKLSDGLEHPSNDHRLVIDIGAVGPGETRTYRLPLAAIKGGTQSVSVVATSSSDASSTDAVEFNVIAPSLKVIVEGPALRYKGRNAKYTMTVTNDGSVVNNNIHIAQTVADGFKFVSADRNGKFDASVKSIHWFVGRLEPGESTQVNCELQSLQIGEFAHTVQVLSDTGVQADARIETRVDGIASLTMELVDLDDPVETGSETGYEIRVKNDGSKAASGVTVTCELPAGMEFLSAKAPVDQIVEGRQLSFKPIEQIAPGGQTTIRIQMKVVRDGSHRMKVRLSGGGLQEPMILEEVTRAYSDGSN